MTSDSTGPFPPPGDPRAIASLASALGRAGSALDGDRALAEGLLAHTGAVAVSVSRFDPAEGRLRVGHVAAAPQVLALIRQALGQGVESINLRPGASREEILRGPWAVELPGLHALFFGQMPEEVANQMEMSLGCGRLYGLALRSQSEVLGTAVIMMPRGQELPLAPLAAVAEAISAALESRT